MSILMPRVQRNDAKLHDKASRLIPLVDSCPVTGLHLAVQRMPRHLAKEMPNYDKAMDFEFLRKLKNHAASPNQSTCYMTQVSAQIIKKERKKGRLLHF